MANLRDAKYSGFPGFKELGIDWEKVNLSLELTEAAIKVYDDVIVLIFKTEDIPDLYKPELFKPLEPTLLIVHRTEYTRWTKDNPKTPTQPFELEVALADYILKQGLLLSGNGFGCSLYLMANAVNLIKTDKLPVFSDIQYFDSDIVMLLPNSTVTNNSSGNRGNTFESKLTNLESVISKLASLENHPVYNMAEYLRSLKTSDPEMYEQVTFVLKLLFG